MSARKTLIKAGVAVTLGVSAWFARRPALAGATRRLMRGFAFFTARTKNIRTATSVADLGEQWQRAFPARKQVPIVRVTDDTVYAQIHTPCPLRGSGDLHACHRMMEFDRAILERAGGQFVVLHSQAEAGRTHCEVAMRRAKAPLQGLMPAHLRAG